MIDAGCAEKKSIGMIMKSETVHLSRVTVTRVLTILFHFLKAECINGETFILRIGIVIP